MKRSQPIPLSRKPGFTLAELLIALALLGIIAAFTIPKVLQSSASQERVAKLRETAATLEQVWYNARAANTLVAGTFYDNTQGQINAVRASSNLVNDVGEALEPVINHPCTAIMPAYPMGYFQFANGVVVSGVSSTNWTVDQLMRPQSTGNMPICIDVNGAASPNEPGQDVFVGLFNPWGDFDMGFAGGAAYAFNTSGKAFMWGNAGEVMRNEFGQPLFAPYNTQEIKAGYWLTQ